MTDRNKAAAGFNALAIGWYGAPNVGDEVLLDILKEQVRSLGGTLVAASVDPALTRRMHGIDAVDYNNLGEIARALSWADVVVMGGGGIFQDHHPFRVEALYDPLLNDISAYARPVLMARQFNVPVVIWGHGVGPLRSADARSIVRDIFDNAAGVSVRDAGSLELLRDIGVSRDIPVGPDPGWLYADICAHAEHQPKLPPDDHQQKRLVVVVREWSLGDVAWKERLISALDQAVTNDWAVFWVAFQSQTGNSGATSDQGLFDELRQRVRAECRGEFLAPSTPREAWTILEGADAIFSMRLHASILGLLAGKSVAGLEYDEKMQNAHSLAEMPEVYRLSLDDPQARFDAALKCLLGDASWKPDPALIRKLKSSAGVHREVLAGCAVAKSPPRVWQAGAFDWMGTWLQQALADLRAARAASLRAHSLLEFRDSSLSQQDAELAARTLEVQELREELKRVQELFEYRSSQLAVAELQQSERASELASLQPEVASHRDELVEAQALSEEWMSEILKERSLNDVLRSERVQLDAELEELARQLRRAELTRMELVDQLQQKSAYIEDKEIHVAQLAFQLELDQQNLELTQATAELEQLKARRSTLVAVLSRIRRNAPKVAASPFKFMALWRRHGLRVAMEQARRRLSTLGQPAQDPNLESENALSWQLPRPVRIERLLVVAGAPIQDGWPSRAVALAKAAERAGFLVRIWHPAAYAGAAGDSGISLLVVGRAELLQLVTRGDTRVLVADYSDAALSFVNEAKERGAEIVLDLASMRQGSVDETRLSSFAGLAARVITRDDALDQRFSDVEHEVLPDGADNEVFDSYKEYAYPVHFRKRRKNILLFVDDVVCLPLVEQLANTFPNEQIHVMGANAELPDLPQFGHVQLLTIRHAEMAPLLSAADIVLIHGQQSGSWRLRSLAMAALLMEKRVISSIRLDGVASPNLQVLEQARWVDITLSAKAVEDYEFVSSHAWLGRVERLMRPQFPNSISVIVLIHNNRSIIERCISTVLEHCEKWLHEIVVVDNQSVDGGAEFVEQRFADHPKVKLVRNSENGCSSGRNLGVKSSSGQYIAFFDSDQWLTAPSSFSEAVLLLDSEPSLGAIGWNAGWFDATRSDLGGAISDYVPNRGMNHAALARGFRGDIGFLGTSGMFMTRELFDRIEGFDTFYDPTCFEDTDICFQIKKAGFVVALRDLAGIRHQPHQTTGASEGSERYRKLFARNAEYFRNKWSGHPEYFVDYS